MKQTVIIDMVNGFCKEGALADPKIMEIVPAIKKEAKGTEVIFIRDRHYNYDREFRVFPAHCVIGTGEDEIIDELSDLKTEHNVYDKTTTNGMWEEQVMKKFHNNNDVVVMGCCTDICVLSFAISLRTYKNKKDLGGEVIIKKSCVATYDAPHHNAKEYTDMALKLMAVQGIQVED